MERRRRGKTNKSKLSGPFISADLVRRMQTIAEGTGAGKDAIPVKMKFTQPRSRNHSSAPRSNGQLRERTGVEISTFYGTGKRERASTGKLVSPVSISRVPDSLVEAEGNLIRAGTDMQTGSGERDIKLFHPKQIGRMCKKMNA